MAHLPKRPCVGLRVLSVARDDWPEEQCLSQWLMEHGNAVKISHRQLATGDLADSLRELLAQPAKPPIAATGAAEAVDWLDRIQAPHCHLSNTNSR
jgi:hypothetical protein